MYKVGNILPFWNDYYKQVPYSRKPVDNMSDEIVWRSLGFTHEFFTGEMCLIEKNKYSWAENFFNAFQGNNIGLTLYKMSPGVIMPTHIDKFSVYKKFFSLNSDKKIFRAIVFLEDWQNGHIFEIENKLFSSWSAGDYVLWDEKTPHMAANLGTTTRYTAQITFTDV